MFRSWRQSVRELGERVERLEGELGRLNMENADLKSQLKERDARIAKLESVLEQSRRAGKRQAAPFSKDKPKRDPKKPGRKPGSKYGRQAVRAIPVPDKTFEAPCPEQCPCGGKGRGKNNYQVFVVIHLLQGERSEPAGSGSPGGTASNGAICSSLRACPWRRRSLCVRVTNYDS